MNCSSQLRLLFPLLSVLLALALAQKINPIKAPIINSNLQVHVRKFAQIPPYKGEASRIVGIVQHGKSLFVTTSVSGGLIYKVSPKGKVSLWFDVNDAIIKSTGRAIEFKGKIHGGLRGLAFHPKFNKNGLFYVSCLENRMGQSESKFRYLGKVFRNPFRADSVVIEFKVNSATRKPIPTSYRSVLRISLPKLDHPIKQIAFKGKHLYITHGDGSEQSALGGGGQNNDGFGKILRINPLKKGSKQYIVPRSNPFTNSPKFLNEIFALGFRNPHNLCFSKSGELFVVDVGRDNVEEVNIVKAGGNYGWSEREGPFKHKPEFGIGVGIAPLPADDAKYGYEYPVAVVGHAGERGSFLMGQALAGSCPIENGSPLSGLMLYANFPNNGKLFYSKLSQMRRAVTKGKPSDLTVAKTFRPKIFYDHDNNPSTPSRRVDHLLQIVTMDKGLAGAGRVDLRFGQGKKGEIYWSSKTNGRIYLITSSLKGAKV